jgi:tripartite-type tricarboxylate transporter receptor subunit TctC
MLAHTLPERAVQACRARGRSRATFSGWTGLLAPRGTPQPVIGKLRNALRWSRRPRSSATRWRARARSRDKHAEEFARLVASELESMGKAARTANLKLE